jgi:Plasmid encoded RepA protein
LGPLVRGQVMKSVAEVLDAESPPAAQARKSARAVVAAHGLAVEIDDLSYLMREFVQCSFPYKSPGKVEEWSREVHGLVLTIKRGRHDFAIPYGVMARLGILWLCTQIVEHPTQDSYQIGQSLAEMLRNLGFNVQTAATSARRKDYIVALRDLFACNISYSNKTGGAGVKCDIGKAWDLWGDNDNLEQGSLFVSWVKPTADFREHVLKSHVPVPNWAIKNHLRSPMELDALFMLSHRVHMLNNRPAIGGKLFITTDALKTQFGNEYARHRDFRAKFNRALTNIESQTWPKLIYEFTEEGLTLRTCEQLVKSRQTDKDAIYRRHRKQMAPARRELIAEIMETRVFDPKTREQAELLLRGLSYKVAAEAFWNWADHKKLQLHDPRAAFLTFCTSHRKRNKG